MIPMMPHMRESSEEGCLYFLLALGPFGSRRAGLQFRTKRRRPPLLCDLPGPAEGHGAGRHVLGNCTARRHVGAAADANRRHKRAVRADEEVSQRR